MQVQHSNARLQEASMNLTEGVRGERVVEERKAWVKNAGTGPLLQEANLWQNMKQQRACEESLTRSPPPDGMGECEPNFKNLLPLNNDSVKGQAPPLASLTPGLFLLISQSPLPGPVVEQWPPALHFSLSSPHPVCKYFFSIICRRAGAVWLPASPWRSLAQSLALRRGSVDTCGVKPVASPTPWF